MKKVHTKQHPFLLALMLLFLTIIAQKGANSLATSPAPKVVDGCNATRIGDCLVDEEFLMESETSRRFLASSSPGPLNRGAFCNRNTYGSCLPNPNKFYKKRSCVYKNLCGRANSGGT
ncbi:hypothetical protein CDL12_25540 [Handroanthus impetiginosus]|uniref:Rapid ALkalinization Factor n=1 Tax=Handroanthus impetiginosus TaxID=429701 RepID=A0A2G9G9I7_9LAMI|nr:hypothetical protein CDL12_25540 [Handroanthus impetiginosus]